MKEVDKIKQIQNQAGHEKDQNTLNLLTILSQGLEESKKGKSLGQNIFFNQLEKRIQIATEENEIIKKHIKLAGTAKVKKVFR